MESYGNNLLVSLNNQKDNEIEQWKNIRSLDKEYFEIAEKKTILNYKQICDSINRVIPKEINGQKAIETHGDFLEYMDKKTFCRKWTKLNVRHMINRIKFYVEHLKYSDKVNKKKQATNKEELINELVNLLNEKKLKSNLIEYDSNEGLITSISIIEKNKETKLYEIDF